MAWRKMLKEDCVRGCLVRIGNIADGYNMATILAVVLPDDYIKQATIRLGRPYAYADKHCDSRTPMLGCEVFEVTIDRATSAETDLEVYQARDGNRSYLVGA